MPIVALAIGYHLRILCHPVSEAVFAAAAFAFFFSNAGRGRSCALTTLLTPFEFNSDTRSSTVFSRFAILSCLNLLGKKKRILCSKGRECPWRPPMMGLRTERPPPQSQKNGRRPQQQLSTTSKVCSLHLLQVLFCIVTRRDN